MPIPTELPEPLRVDIPVGGRVVVGADLHLRGDPSDGDVAAHAELATAVGSATGPGVLIIAGGLFDAGVSVPEALAANPDLVTRLATYARGPGRRVVVLPGDRDAQLAWSEEARVALRDRLGAEVAPSVDLVIDTGAGSRVVRVEAGRRFDALARVDDPFNPRETPFVQHLRDEVMPSVRRRHGAAVGRHGWLAGMEQLDDPAAFSRFIASRLAYRRLGRSSWLLIPPVIAVFALRLPELALRSARAGALSSRLFILAAITVLELLLLVVLATAALRQTNTALSALALDEDRRDRNDEARAAGRELVTAGRAGLVSAHTCRAELTHLGTGFYANPGSVSEVVTECPSRLPGLGLPPAFLAFRQLSWVEMEAGNDVHVRLIHSLESQPGATFVERLLTRHDGRADPVGRWAAKAQVVSSWLDRDTDQPREAGKPLGPTQVSAARPAAATSRLRPQVVAAFPRGASWPRPDPAPARDRRVRRLASFGVLGAGFFSLVSALSEPLRDRINFLNELFPIAVPETAAALAALGGIGLIILARGIRRGQRRAWAVCLMVLAAITVLHVLKGVDLVAIALALAAAAYLWVNRASFQARTDVAGLRRGVLMVIAATISTLVAGTIALELSLWIGSGRRHPAVHRIPWLRALQASAGRMLGLYDVELPHRLDEFFSPAMGAAAVGLALALLVVVFRPVVRRHQGRLGVASGRAVSLEAALVGPSTGPGGDPTGDDSDDSGGDAWARRREPGPGINDEGDGDRRPLTGSRADSGMARARAIFARHGSGTLDYFALRPDKDFFFWGDTLVAHAVYGGVCLVSPDPIGPVAEREEAWRAFRRYVDQQGWALGGLGAGEEWLPIYRAGGMHDLYVGDEGVVDISQFTLEGGKFKGLRQAVNRVAKYGYRISFHDPSRIDPDLRAALESVMTKSRRGDVERGFSMTLGRVFDPADAGLLLAVVHGPAGGGDDHGTPGAGSGPTGAQPGATGTAGRAGKAGAGGNGATAFGRRGATQSEDEPGGLGPPVAFCQYVPAPGIGGYSLDLMRRDDGEHPNGLIDFAVVETIRELKARGHTGLGLNFATMRAVLAGETGEGAIPRVQAWVLSRMGGSMQIESLWKFNAKFDPDWLPRYAVYDAPENILAVAIAVARAESFWELPVIGRFLVPSASRGEDPVPVAGS